MDINPDVFWNLTMREFQLKQRGYLERLEDEQIHGWNLTRTLACYILKPHLKKGSKMNPTDIMYLPIDGKTKSEIDIEKRRKLGILAAKKAAKFSEKNKNKEKKEIGLESLMLKKH
jgi:hypothetical protein|tara:strand:+ start:1077 stop:1424 length:348 start_codon:yes stop_codon:yes gene_type:complete